MPTRVLVTGSCGAASLSSRARARARRSRLRILAAVFDAETIAAWAWRVPFVLGIGVGLAGFYVRRHTVEMAAAAISLVVTLGLRETARAALR